MKQTNIFPKRKFTVVLVSTHDGKKGKQNLGGTFTKTPRAAAIKAASRICSHSKIKGRCALNVVVKEITPGSHGKMYAYHVLRIKNERTVEHGGVVVKHGYTLKATAIKDFEYLFEQTKTTAKKPKATPKPKQIKTHEEVYVYMGEKPSQGKRSSLGLPQQPVGSLTEEEAIFTEEPIDILQEPIPSMFIQQTPKIQGQTPKIQGQTPKIQGQMPKIQGQTPKIQGQTPKIQGQTPKIQGQTPKIQGQTPKQPQKPKNIMDFLFGTQPKKSQPVAM